MIELKGVSKTYPDGDGVCCALKNIDLTIHSGMLTAIIGKSGSGKSTLFNLIGAVDAPSKGSILVDNEDISKLSAKALSQYRGSKVGYIFQSFFIEPGYTVYQNIALPLMINGVDKKERDKMVHSIAERVGLSHKLNSKAGKLSGGEKQRAAIARALVYNPSVILADEPCGNLDDKNRAEIMELLRSCVSPDRSVLLITHNNEDATLCDRVITLSDGSVVSSTDIRRTSD